MHAELSDCNFYPLTMDPKAVATPKPMSQAVVMATADPVLLALPWNISPTSALGMVPNPGNDERFHLFVIKKNI